MSVSNGKRSTNQAFQDYYEDLDYSKVMALLPDIVKEAELRASQVQEPTIDEKREVMGLIKEFIRTKKRKVYGGTAINETIKVRSPKDAIYSDVKFSDIEFYSPTPVVDLVELCNLLYQKGYKFVQGKEAQHEETYSIFVNLQLYCDISYVPQYVYHAIQSIEIDGILYTHPHFILIDQLRIFNDPMNAAFRWEKTFDRVFKVLKNYPFELIDRRIQIPPPPDEVTTLFSKLKSEFLNIPEAQNTCLISGFEAYNFFVRHAARDRKVEQMARTTYKQTKFDELVTHLPFMDFVSVDYQNMVIRLYQYLQSIVSHKEKLSLREYFPLFQFTGYSVIIYYKDHPVARVIKADGLCIPNIKTTRGYMYVSYQYLLMSLLINKFRSFLDKDKTMYLNYHIAISHLVRVRNIYLTENNLDVINNTVFGEFKISCVGSSESYMRISMLRKIEKRKNRKGKFKSFVYTPEEFFKMSEEEQARFDPSRYQFRNTSGNLIRNPKNLIFRVDEEGNISENTKENENSEESVDTLNSGEEKEMD